MALTLLSIDEINALSADEIENVTSIKCLMSCFGQGANGRKVETSEMKNLTKEERDSLAADCRLNPLVLASL